MVANRVVDQQGKPRTIILGFDWKQLWLGSQLTIIRRIREADTTLKAK